MDPSIADSTLHRLARMLPTPGVRQEAWPGPGAVSAARCSLHTGDVRTPVVVERISVAGARLLAPTASLVQLSRSAPAGRPEALRLRVQHPRLDQPLHLPCLLIGARSRGVDHALAVRFCAPDAALDGIHAALKASFDQRVDPRIRVREDVVPVLIYEAWRGRRLRGVIQDLSARGLGIVLDLGVDAAPTVGEPVALRFRLPGQAEKLLLHGEVRRVVAHEFALAGEGVLIEVGMALTETADADQEAAARITAHLDAMG